MTELIFPFVFTAIILILLLPIAFYVGEGKAKKRQARGSKVEKTLAMVLSCNSYPRMNEVFEDLERNTKKYGIKVHDSFKGYLGDEQKGV